MSGAKKVIAPAVGFMLGGPMGAAVALGGQAALKGMMPKMPNMPAIPAAGTGAGSTPTLDDPRVAAEAEEERKRQLAARGRASTVLTGSRGLVEEPGLASRTLL